MKKILFSIIGTIGLLTASFGQEYDEDGFNPLGSKKIHRSDIMWKKTVTRRLDLREKQNMPLYSKEHEISGLIVDAVREGIITPYKNDSLKSKMSIDEFLSAITLPAFKDAAMAQEMGMEDDFDNMEDDMEGGFDDMDDGMGEEEEAVSDEDKYFFPKDLYLIDLAEDIIFDKQRSRQYYDIISFTFYLSADHPENLKKIDEVIASFSYKELMEKLFKDNPEAIWFNPYNDSEHRNLTDAFELRLFHGYIIKVSNPRDELLIDIYGGNVKTGIMASQWKAFELLEYEHNLWEF